MDVSLPTLILTCCGYCNKLLSWPILCLYCSCGWLATVWFSGNVLVLIDIVCLHKTRSTLGWVTISWRVKQLDVSHS